MKTIKELENKLKEYDFNIECDDQDHNAYHLKAKTLFEIGKLKNNDKASFDEALKAFNKAASLQPNNIVYLSDRSNFYAQIGKPEAALADIEGIEKLSTSSENVIHSAYAKETISNIKAILEQNTNDKTVSLADEEEVKQQEESKEQNNTQYIEDLKLKQSAIKDLFNSLKTYNLKDAIELVKTEEFFASHNAEYSESNKDILLTLLFIDHNAMFSDTKYFNNAVQDLELLGVLDSG